MDMIKQKWKKNLISKTWERCKSVGYSSSNKSSAGNSLTRSKTWHCTTKSSSSSPEKERPNNKCHQVAPEGCFTVYVGPQKERFVVNTKFANHPLFKMLLEDAELEYGYDTQGPILLPCKVDLFYKVLAAMESEDDDDIDHHHPKGYSPLILCSPARRPSHRSSKAYRLFSPSRLLKLNGF
ncbi:hypothetical protein JRO89_XS01G0396900 [Xanthoceras sorbifolium]|uniref:Uncharacterized protein n=1 Tax=Xanthoceras sorbifolium TaxID=99658 RepID=A0ABQ8IPS9_9ROSI|nr:hypothetical protein JRO89_XS01G0396900 [Xanthoceras sorbifolium]